MIEILQLEKSEFPILRTIEEGYCPDPNSSIALIAKDGDEIVARMLLIAPAHIEGTWIKESHRGGAIFFRLMSQMEICAKRAGMKKVFAYIAAPEIEDYVGRLGYSRVPVTVWGKDL